MIHQDAVAGSTVMLVTNVVDQVTLSNNPVTGQAPTVAIQRLSDGNWFDFVAGLWDTFASYALIGATNKQVLTDQGDGSYGYEWDQNAADAGVERIYEMTYEVPAGDYQGTAKEQWDFRASPAAATAGSGPRTVIITVENQDGDLLEGVVVVITNQAETSGNIAGPDRTDENGQVVFHMNDGTDYRAIPRSSGALSGGATNFTVSGATPVTCVMTQASLPAPAPADCYVLYCNERDEHDTPVGVADVVVQVIGMTETAMVDVEAEAMRGILNIDHETNAQGQWSFAIAKALDGAGLGIKKTFTDAGNHRVEQEWWAKIDGDKADEDDLMPWAALGPRKIR